jgi:hypothetical protein
LVAVSATGYSQLLPPANRDLQRSCSDLDVSLPEAGRSDDY